MIISCWYENNCFPIVPLRVTTGADQRAGGVSALLLLLEARLCAPEEPDLRPREARGHWHDQLVRYERAPRLTVDRSQHLKHENPTFSPTFQSIVKRLEECALAFLCRRDSLIRLG